MNSTDLSSQSAAVESLIRRLRMDDDMIRGPALQGAGSLGAPAVAPLVAEMCSSPPGTAQAARRALWNVVRFAGRPGAGSQGGAVVSQIREVFGQAPAAIQRELIWMISELGDQRVVPWLSELLDHPELREDARCALMRIPGARALAALRTALSGAEGPFAGALADALRARGESVVDPPSRNRTPDRSTTVGQ